MSDTFQSGVISLVRSALYGGNAVIPDGFDWQKTLKLAKEHQIQALIYHGTVNSGTEMPSQIKTALETSAFKSLALDRNQVYTIGKLLDAFQENGIDHLPLKGTVLKSMYPKSEFRSMSDADILIKPEQYGAIAPIMQKFGYVNTGESDHEYIWQKENVLTVELHKRLIPSYNRDYYAYYGDGWRLARKIDGNRYGMSDEDQLIYLFTHFAKHYRDGGIGIRHFTDLYIYLSAKPDMDTAYIGRELKKPSLDVFYQNVRDTLRAWFEDAPESEITGFITARIFSSGSYGTQTDKVLSSAVKEESALTNRKNARARRILRVVFPSYALMADSFPSLKRFPFLLPAFWAVRWFRALLFRRENIVRVKTELDIASAKRTETYHEELHFVGLDFNFKE